MPGFPTIALHFLPSHSPPQAHAGATVVVVDVLRATTTMTYALEAGADRIVLFSTPEEALEIFDSLPPRVTVLGGERGGFRISKFHLGNSPAEYTREVVEGKSILFTTTNGTAAALHAGRAARVLFGCFANLSSIARVLVTDTHPIHILCAGTGGEISLDDCMFAGALAARLRSLGCTLVDPDHAQLAIAAYERASAGEGGLAAGLSQTRGGRNLAAVGLGSDTALAARVDTCTAVGEMDIATRIVMRKESSK